MSVVGHPFREVWFETVKSMYFHLTFTVPPDPQEYKWVLANCQGSLMILEGGGTLQWTSIPWGGEVVILLVAYAMEIRMTSDWVGHLARVQTFLSFVVVGLFRSEFNREVNLESFPGARDLNLF